MLFLICLAKQERLGMDHFYDIQFLLVGIAREKFLKLDLIGNLFYLAYNLIFQVQVFPGASS